MHCTLLGTGTSHGIPVIACDCECCRSTDPRDIRFRTSLWVTDDDPKGVPSLSILVDTGPDFRSQALRFGIHKLDTLLLTHGHADHMNGLDDIRIFSHTCSREPPAQDGSQRIHPETKGNGLPVYGNSSTLKDLHERFAYIFQPTKEGGGKPKIHMVDSELFSAKKPLEVGGIQIVPIPMKHGSLDTTGWLFKQKGHSVAYLTDCSFIPDSSVEILRNEGSRLEHIVIDGLRDRPHSTHLSFSQAVDYAVQIGARHTWLTHICHDMTHTKIRARLKQIICETPRRVAFFAAGNTVEPAYDGLVLSV